jgi:hypothetical protein
MEMRNPTARELWLLQRLYGSCQDVKATYGDEEFDVQIEGVRPDGMKFNAQLRLGAIHQLLDWASIAWETSYPEMVLEGDWSGIRDSDPERIRAIFQRHIIPMMPADTYTQTLTAHQLAKRLLALPDHKIAFDGIGEDLWMVDGSNPSVGEQQGGPVVVIELINKGQIARIS